jgi:FAD binding domain of DNA photolyase
METRLAPPAMVVQCSYCGRRHTGFPPLDAAIATLEMEGWTHHQVEGGTVWRCPEHPMPTEDRDVEGHSSAFPGQSDG